MFAFAITFLSTVLATVVLLDFIVRKIVGLRVSWVRYAAVIISVLVCMLMWNTLYHVFTTPEVIYNADYRNV